MSNPIYIESNGTYIIDDDQTIFIENCNIDNIVIEHLGGCLTIRSATISKLILENVSHNATLIIESSRIGEMQIKNKYKNKHNYNVSVTIKASVFDHLSLENTDLDNTSSVDINTSLTIICEIVSDYWNERASETDYKRYTCFNMDDKCQLILTNCIVEGKCDILTANFGPSPFFYQSMRHADLSKITCCNAIINAYLAILTVPTLIDSDYLEINSDHIYKLVIPYDLYTKKFQLCASNACLQELPLEKIYAVHYQIACVNNNLRSIDLSNIIGCISTFNLDFTKNNIGSINHCKYSMNELQELGLLPDDRINFAINALPMEYYDRLSSVDCLSIQKACLNKSQINITDHYCDNYLTLKNTLIESLHVDKFLNSLTLIDCLLDKLALTQFITHLVIINCKGSHIIPTIVCDRLETVQIDNSDIQFESDLKCVTSFTFFGFCTNTTTECISNQLCVDIQSWTRLTVLNLKNCIYKNLNLSLLSNLKSCVLTRCYIKMLIYDIKFKLELNDCIIGHKKLICKHIERCITKQDISNFTVNHNMNCNPFNQKKIAGIPVSIRKSDGYIWACPILKKFNASAKGFFAAMLINGSDLNSVKIEQKTLSDSTKYYIFIPQTSLATLFYYVNSKLAINWSNSRCNQNDSKTSYYSANSTICDLDRMDNVDDTDDMIDDEHNDDICLSDVSTESRSTDAEIMASIHIIRFKYGSGCYYTVYQTSGSNPVPPMTDVNVLLTVHNPYLWPACSEIMIKYGIISMHRNRLVPINGFSIGDIIAFIDQCDL